MNAALRPDLADWPQAYYGPNVRQLRRVQARYDADDFFRGLQTLRPG